MNPIAAKLQLLQPAVGDFYPTTLEQDAPHILSRVVALWDKPELLKFLAGLQVRIPSAKGFSLAAQYEISRLEELILAARNHEEGGASKPVQPEADALSDHELLIKKVRAQISGLGN